MSERCPRRKTIDRLIGGSLLPDRVRRLEIHMARCPVCRRERLRAQSEAAAWKEGLAPLRLRKRFPAPLGHRPESRRFRISRRLARPRTRPVVLFVLPAALAAAALFAVAFFFINDDPVDVPDGEGVAKGNTVGPREEGESPVVKEPRTDREVRIPVGDPDPGMNETPAPDADGEKEEVVASSPIDVPREPVRAIPDLRPAREFPERNPAPPSREETRAAIARLIPVPGTRVDDGEGNRRLVTKEIDLAEGMEVLTPDGEGGSVLLYPDGLRIGISSNAALSIGGDLRLDRGRFHVTSPGGSVHVIEAGDVSIRIDAFVELDLGLAKDFNLVRVAKGKVGVRGPADLELEEGFQVSCGAGRPFVRRSAVYWKSDRDLQLQILRGVMDGDPELVGAVADSWRLFGTPGSLDGMLDGGKWIVQNSRKSDREWSRTRRDLWMMTPWPDQSVDSGLEARRDLLVQQGRRQCDRLELLSISFSMIRESLIEGHEGGSYEKLLRRFRSETEPRLRALLLEIMARHHAEAFGDDLPGFLRKEREAESRLVLLRLLPSFPMNEETISLVGKWVSGSMEGAAMAAVRFLGESGKPSAVPLLIDSMRRVSGRAGREMTRALERLTGRSCGEDSSAWMEWWKRFGKAWSEGDAAAGEDLDVAKMTDPDCFGIRHGSGRVVFLIDVSGSIESRMKNVLSEVERALKRLSREDRFNIILFDSRIRVFQPEGMAVASSEMLTRAMEFLRRASSGHNVAIFEMIAHAFDLAGGAGADWTFDRQNADAFVLVSDGDWSDRDDPEPLVRRISRLNLRAGVRIHGVCLDRGSSLMERLSEETGGAFVIW